MGIFDIFQRNKDPEQGLKDSADRSHRFVLKKKLSSDGIEYYYLSNQANQQMIKIPRHLMDSLRHNLRHLWSRYQQSRDALNEIDFSITFKGQECYRITSLNEQWIEVQELQQRRQPGGERILRLAPKALPALVDLLYHPELKHPSEALRQIVHYHRLFQFTFVEGSQSINSDLTIRKDVLYTNDRYHPPIHRSLGQSLPKTKSDDTGDVIDSGERSVKKGNPKLFKSRLAERMDVGEYNVDYAKLLAKSSDENDSMGGALEPSAQLAHSSRSKTDHIFSLPLRASDIREHDGKSWQIELSNEEIQEFRSRFLNDREQELYIGFEIIDAVYKHNGKLMTFNFPLYYARVSVQESNRHLILEPEDQGLFFLNHLALANLVAERSPNSNGKEPYDEFFQTLLAQRIEYKDQLHPIWLMRQLPVDQKLFDRTLEVFLGAPGEMGKGGILGHLKVVGIECDRQSVFLYRSPKNISTLTMSLDMDLEHILKTAMDRPAKFQRSLLGNFLTTTSAESRARESFAKNPMIPGAIPRATKRLLKHLNQHDLVLLEGPPGTGKTYTIFNLFLHSIISGKKVLIVSDQGAAISALTEKFEDYLYGKERGTAKHRNLEQLWKCAIKVIDKIPTTQGSLQNWIQILKEQLSLDASLDFHQADDVASLDQELKALDQRIEQKTKQIQKIMEKRTGPHADERFAVAAKRDHDYTYDEIIALAGLIRSVAGDSQRGSRLDLLDRFAKNQKWVARPEIAEIRDVFDIPDCIDAKAHAALVKVRTSLASLLNEKPRLRKGIKLALQKIKHPSLQSFIHERFQKHFPENSHWILRSVRVLTSLIRYPLARELQVLMMLLDNQSELFKICAEEAPQSGIQWRRLQKFIQKDTSDKKIPTVIEIVRQQLIREAKGQSPSGTMPLVMEMLDQIAEAQDQRDDLIRKKLVYTLTEMAQNVTKTDEQRPTNLATSINAQLDAIKAHNSVESAKTLWQDFQEAFASAYPIVVCRKQSVPFLFPCAEQMFDLVVVDEATQCKVDDALPLLYRGKKILVVGDEKQTVLAKNSSVDDFLFDAFGLEDHLRVTQAHGMKGGGSHLFGLVKAIKQASVMLDEHYRCPPEIIEYSNRYVYNSELKIMQWKPAGTLPSVVIDYSERKRSSARVDSGQFKGIETDMVDRFLDYVAREIKNIEQQTGQRVNVETDVALCYFLLKNEPYVKRVKGEFLRKLGRGSDILDGAGAALQGKEREFIFYLWDVTRSNMMAFKQGDEADKRKGELNVLMSRPKVRAYHFLHCDFEKLDHNKATITDYLWKQYNQQKKGEVVVKLQPRRNRPDPELAAWQRHSGQMLEHLVGNYVELGPSPIDDGQERKGSVSVQYSVTVGDSRRAIDLVLGKKEGKQHRYAGIIDLAGFDAGPDCAEEIVNYFFQLKRASPKLEPIFCFVHELASPAAPIARRIVKILGSGDKKALRRGA